MTESSVFEPAGRAVSYAEEGDGPVALVLIPERGLEGDALGVVAHYLAEEAGFHIVRIGSRTTSAPSGSEAAAMDERVEDVVAVMDLLGLDHAWIGGHGAGGTVARAVVAAHADRANGLLLLGVEDAQTALAPAIPVLIVQGTDDDITPPAIGERLQATAPDRASIKTIGGAGHLFPMTHAVETAVVIEEYLDWD
ncbi:alpha/beta fold hydrolase [Microbacterium allomyrinae]|uniref:Alpha/beta hydrolase n=1 Tax=Microbacterium allomyrinae TaxID=2830666 RepID=A0A9X1LRR8_9MICO|nr:alpha/beta hydrolase [Microbacterium allomyrinae]MCC2030602.1 alpha/beta hydrolase [Microbacterium allomyrinae]